MLKTTAAAAAAGTFAGCTSDSDDGDDGAADGTDGAGDDAGSDGSDDPDDGAEDSNGGFDGDSSLSVSSSAFSHESDCAGLRNLQEFLDDPDDYDEWIDLVNPNDEDVFVRIGIPLFSENFPSGDLESEWEETIEGEEVAWDPYFDIDGGLGAWTPSGVDDLGPLTVSREERTVDGETIGVYSGTFEATVHTDGQTTTVEGEFSEVVAKARTDCFDD